MKSFFNVVTRLSLRFRAVTLSLVVVILALGGVAGSQLKQELLPPIEFPQTFILAQASGMTSEQVLNVVTNRIEAEISKVPEVVNLESTTTSAIGAVIIASNDFGLNQAKLRGDMQRAIDTVWFPSREFRATEGEDVQAFATARLEELSPDVWLYLQQRNGNFLFELRPEVWASLSEESLNAILGYLANQVLETGGDKTALERLVEQEIVPQLNAAAQVANIQVAGGQALPGEESVFGGTVDDNEPRSYLLQLSPNVWRAIQARVNRLGAQDNTAVESLKANAYVLPESIPALPTGWQTKGFSTAQDLQEMQTGTRSSAVVLSDFLNTGVIRGSLGQTDDLTADDITRMLAIDPSMVEHFNAEQLVSLSSEAFNALPRDFIAGLDGFTQDELVALEISRSFVGVDFVPAPVNLPNSWRIQPPQIITFSLASIPLATFSVFSTAEVVETVSIPTTENTPSTVTETPTGTASLETTLPEGEPLPQLFTLIGGFFGAQLDTTDDLIRITLSGDIAEQFGITELRGADFFNQLTQLSGTLAGGGAEGATAGFGDVNIAEFVPALTECGVGLLDVDLQNLNLAAIVIGCVSPEMMTYLVANDPQFLPALNSTVFDYLRDDVLALEGVTPPLSDAWRALTEQLRDADLPLATAFDVVALGDGSPSSVLNKLNASVPQAFSGYEVRILDGISVGVARYFVIKEPNFFANLDEAVVVKLSPEILSLIPAEIVAVYGATTIETIQGVISGVLPSAAVTLAERYVTDSNVPPTDPTAPVLNSEWQQLVSFVTVDQLDNASDFFRLPATSGTPAQFINNLMVQAPPAFARSLVNGLSAEAVAYIEGRDATFSESLSVVVLQGLNADTLASLPSAIQDRATAGEIFIPTNRVTRTNGSPSLLVTITKDQNANTVEAFYAVKAIVEAIDAENDEIAVVVAFEQSSFVEESISGVVREGTLGAFFAVIVILVFLSSGAWSANGRRVTGIAITVVGFLFLALLVGLGLSAANGDVATAWNGADTVFRVLGIGAILVGLWITFGRGNVAYPAWRSTLVIAVSIPLSVAVSLAMMRWFPPLVNGLFAPMAEDGNAFFTFLLRLAPANLTLNIMTLSGLTVAVGRVVDDSIVVLENITRQMQQGTMTKYEAIISGVKDVSSAIFSATMITVIVFLPLGLTGGLVGEFFLPFGLAVTYSLIASFIVAITVVPVLVEMFISENDNTEEENASEGRLQRAYVASLKLALKNPFTMVFVLVVAFASAAAGFGLFATRPATFLPDFGEPQISINLNLPQGTRVLETDAVARQLETLVRDVVGDDLDTLQTIVAGGGLDLSALIGGGGGVSENIGQLTVTIKSGDEALLDEYTRTLREESLKLLGEETVSVSKTNLTSQGFGSFEMVLSGSDQSELARLDQCILNALGTVEGLANVSSNLSSAGLATATCPTLSYSGTLGDNETIEADIVTAITRAVSPAKVIVRVLTVDSLVIEVSSVDDAVLTQFESQIEEAIAGVDGVSDLVATEHVASESTGEQGAVVYFRINGDPALSYAGEIETEDTINLVTRAIETVQGSVELPEGYTIGQGFDSQFQTEGFAGIFVAIGIAGAIVCAILVLVFGSPVYWLAVILSVVVAPVGAAIALTLSDRELGISSLIGLLMLLGLVVTNAVVLIDRVGSNRSERKMSTYDALIEAGSRRLRPILMTALATIFALLPLALGLSRGALIAESLGTVVIGGLISSTLLTLIVVPVAYYVFTPIHNFFIRSDSNTPLRDSVAEQTAE